VDAAGVLRGWERKAGMKNRREGGSIADLCGMALAARLGTITSQESSGEEKRSTFAEPKIPREAESRLFDLTTKRNELPGRRKLHYG